MIPRVADPVVRVLFVCTGNTCRSPMAEVIARASAQRRELIGFRFESAGTCVAEGSGATEAAANVARGQGLSLADHAARALTAELVISADLIVGMSAAHLTGLPGEWEGLNLALATHFLAEDDPAYGRDVPDPIGGGRGAYEETYGLLARCVAGLVDTLVRDSSPGGSR